MNSRQSHLSPLGTARERVLRARGLPLAGGNEAPPVPDELWTAAGETLDQSDLYLAWELARCAGPLEPQEQRSVLCLCAVCMLNLRGGSTCLPLAPQVLAKSLRDLGLEGESASIQGLLEAARRGEGPGRMLIGAPGASKPFILDGDLLYLGRMLHLEERLASRLRARMEAEPLVDARTLENALADVQARAPALPARLQLSDEQREAVATAARSPLAVVSGGPGTGKTSIVVSILRVLLRLGLTLEQIALAAPTGKAANRMQEALTRYLAAIPDPSPEDQAFLDACPEPRTLHRLLSYSPSRDRFLHHEHNPLAEQVVIVDEASMVDLALLDQLVRSVRPEARLVLLGDAEQLPSVSAGAVLRDLVPTDAGPATPEDLRTRCSVRLKKSYRMDPSQPDGLNILSAADCIRRGDSAALRGPGDASVAARANAADVRFERMELLAAANEASSTAFLDRWFDARIASLPELRDLLHQTYVYGEGGFSLHERQMLARLFAHTASARILCLTNGYSEGTGADFCNQHLHQRLLERVHGTIADGGGVGALRTGDPVLMQANDYERGLFNGDQGLVLMVKQGSARPGLRAIFPMKDGFGVFPLGRLPVQLCYSMTVHKAQGSEFDHVALMLPRSDLPLLSREVLYTAVTRARHSVTLVGDEALLRRGIDRPLERHSGIARRLRA